MPRNNELKKILLIGSGPIVIGQGCEFDYSGVQACKALREEGYVVVLVNSNPATIMTDPEFADRTYVEPITPEVIEAIMEREKPGAILPTLGGQTALNAAMELNRNGALARHGVKLIGANAQAIAKGEDRQLFKEAMLRIGLEVPRSGVARSLADLDRIVGEIGTFPLIIRPAFTLGGTGGGIAYNREELDVIAARGLDLSPVHEVLIEESLVGWKEFEMEVMRDRMDNCVVVCSIENFDPMGVHTGDSITVAPAQTLSDKEYQMMRDAAFAVIREIGVETGGSNIQFAVHPETGRMVVIEMNPRVSRSSALASKATGFPIAKIAAKLAVGYTLDEIKNDITRETPACFEPTIDYCVVKVPRFTFEKFPQADETLTTRMKSVGEAMAIGRTFKEALRSLEIKRFGLCGDGADKQIDPETLRLRLSIPNAERIFYLAQAFQDGMSIDEVSDLTKIDKWFLRNVEEIVSKSRCLKTTELFRAKKLGFTDRQLAVANETSESEIRARRKSAGVLPTYRLVDTCAAEFEAYTPYYYSTYGDENERRESGKRKIMILGGGPNRIGQGIEFDYCCVHAAFALRELGFETIMVNSNPETVSTDYDTSDKLYFEPLTLEDVLTIVREEKPFGVIVQFGGQTPLKLAIPLEQAGVPVLGTSPDSIDRAEDRERFKEIARDLGLTQPANGTARSAEEAVRVAAAIGYPILVRPSYVLGGRAMEIVYDRESLARYMQVAVRVSPAHPVLIDQFLEDAVEVDVDAVSDGERVVIGGIMEHIERAGVHSGDSACSLPPYSLDAEVQAEIRRQTVALARELGVVGLMNVQFAVKANCVFVLEVNPRASRTVPFVSKAIGIPLAKIAARCMVGRSLAEQGFTAEVVPAHVSVKEAVFPFIKFPGVDTVLGPEMKSTGEVMGIDGSFGAAFAKAQIAAGTLLPARGQAFISVPSVDYEGVVPVARRLAGAGFALLATRGTAAHLGAAGLAVRVVNKVSEGGPHVVDALRRGEVALVVNTPAGADSQRDAFHIRRTALECRVPYFTTLAAAAAAAEGIDLMGRGPFTVRPLQEHHRRA